MTRRGRGRPPTFIDAQRTLYLDLITEGLSLDDAATRTGITRQWANRVAANDPSFNTARELAKKEGKRARIDRLPHDEYRYNHHKCRCTTCRTAATQARTGRRTKETDDTTSPDTPHPPQVIDMRQRTPTREESTPPPLLARAS
ncbi:hypothetical protein ACFQ0X_44080 [Streptomyces rectiviolaceus]|uniref:hypothetical protein n=1 Tax=Streptomyces rectiviolaceus TaxID=332591 RepID=UPI0031DC735B